MCPKTFLYSRPAPFGRTTNFGWGSSLLDYGKEVVMKRFFVFA